MTVSMAIAIAIVVAIFYAVGKSIMGLFGMGGGPARHCMNCGTEGKPDVRTRGSIFIEIVLWICLIVPGLIYSLWRLTTRQKVCSACGSENLIPIGSPAALSHKKTLATP